MWRPCWLYRVMGHGISEERVTPHLSEEHAETCGPEGQVKGSWRISFDRLTDEELGRWCGDHVLERAPDPPPPCEEYMVIDETFFLKGEECRHAGVARVNVGGDSWTNHRLRVRSPEWHVIPTGPAHEIAAILRAAEEGQDKSFKRIALRHDGEHVVVWNPRSTGSQHPDDFLRIKRTTLSSLLRAWLRPQET